MANPGQFLVVLIALASVVSADKAVGSQVCVGSCSEALLSIVFAGKGGKACYNSLRVSSIFYCAKIHCRESVLAVGIDWLDNGCATAAPGQFTIAAYESATANATSAFLEQLPTVNLKESDVINNTVVPSADAWYLAYGTLNQYNTRRDLSNTLRWAVYGFWGLVLFIGMCGRAISFLHARLAIKPVDKESGGWKKCTSSGPLWRLQSWTRTYITLPPAFGHHNHEPYGWATIPLRLQSLVIVVYVIMHIFLMSQGIAIFEGDLYYKLDRTQVLRYFSDRASIIMSSGLPFLWLFGGRNNPFIWLTGWSFRTFNLFHRWVAKVIVVEAIIHGSGMTAFYINDGGYVEYKLNLGESYFRCGIWALTTLVTTLFLSLYPFRKHIYELFHTVHVLLSIIFLIAFYYHTFQQFSGYYLSFIWACVSIWSFDYAVRLFRLITLNYKAIAGKDVPALATYSEETGMIRLDAFPSYQPNPSPGHHYYMYFLGFKAWESHPFSLAEWGWPSDIDIARVVTPQGPSSTDKDQEKQSYVKEQQVSSESPGDKIGEHRLTFMIKPRGGMTWQLREKLKKKGSGVPQRVRVLLEGPYGVPAKLETFSNILFIAGGSGITAILPYIRSIADRNKQSNVVAIPNARLIWIAKKEGFVRDVLTRGLRSTLSSSPVHLQAEYYIPEDANTGSGESGNSENDGGEFQYGKPDFDALIRKALLETRDRLAVFVCGPPAMADSIRTLVTILSHQEGNRLELFEELFGW